MEKLRVIYNKVVDHFKNEPGQEFIPVLQPPGSDTAESLLSDAKKVEPILDEIVKAFIHKANEVIDPKKQIKTSRFKLAATKSKERINRKAENEYKGNFNDIRDVARGSVKLNDNEKIAALSAVFDWAYKNQVELPGGAMVVVSENRFTKPLSSGYSSHKVNIAIPIPGEPGRWHITEVMLMHDEFEKDIEASKKNRFGTNSHQTYEKYRYLEDVAETRALTRDEAKVLGMLKKTLKEIHFSARETHNIDQITGLTKKYKTPLELEAFEQFEHEMKGLE